MEPEDFFQPEVAITAVVAAAIFSPRGRRLIRRGLVYGTAGALMAGDAVASFARSVGQGFQQAGASVAQTAQNAANQVQEQAKMAEESAAHPGERRATRKSTPDQARTSTEVGG
jgi:hypothetical protein